jgi:hypothetical protein
VHTPPRDLCQRLRRVTTPRTGGPRICQCQHHSTSYISQHLLAARFHASGGQVGLGRGQGQGQGGGQGGGQGQGQGQGHTALALALARPPSSQERRQEVFWGVNIGIFSGLYGSFGRHNLQELPPAVSPTECSLSFPLDNCVPRIWYQVLRVAHAKTR